MRRDKAKWVRVSRREPCAVCGHSSWCTRSADGTLARCSRIESDKKSEGRDGQMAWIHRLDAPLPEVEPAPKAEAVSPEVWGTRCRKMFERREAVNGREQLARDLGVSVDALERLQVGIGYDWRGKQFWSFPERDVRWQVIGIKRRYADGDKRHMPGAKPGLTMAQDWWVNPGPVLMPEGGSDVAALLTMGLCAVGRPSNTGGVEYLIGLLRDCEHKPLIVLGENDRKPERVGKRRVEDKDESGQRLCPRQCRGCSWCWPGKYGAIVTADRLTRALRRRVYWRMVKGAKDAREWLNLYGCDGYAFVESLGVPKSWLESVKVLEELT